MGTRNDALPRFGMFSWIVDSGAYGVFKSSRELFLGFGSSWGDFIKITLDSKWANSFRYRFSSRSPSTKFP
jgi:hypothetical protein